MERYKAPYSKAMLERIEAKRREKELREKERARKKALKSGKNLTTKSGGSKIDKALAGKKSASESGTKSEVLFVSGDSDHMIRWLINHELINWQGLCRKAGIPLDVVKLAVHGRTMKGLYKKMPIPSKHLPVLTQVLAEYGYRPGK